METLRDPVVSKHGQGLDISELSQPLACKERPEIRDEDLCPLVEGDPDLRHVWVQDGLIFEALKFLGQGCQEGLGRFATGFDQRRHRVGELGGEDLARLCK